MAEREDVQHTRPAMRMQLGPLTGRNACVQHSRCVVLEEERVRIWCRDQRIELIGSGPDLVRSIAHPRQPMPYAETLRWDRWNGRRHRCSSMTAIARSVVPAPVGL